MAVFFYWVTSAFGFYIRQISDCEVYMKGIDVSYMYEGYEEFKVGELK